MRNLQTKKAVQPAGTIHPARRMAKFTQEQHLRVQREIERRAYQLWRMHDRCFQHALSDWLQAENEVMGTFISHLQTQSFAASL